MGTIQNVDDADDDEAFLNILTHLPRFVWFSPHFATYFPFFRPMFWFVWNTENNFVKNKLQIEKN